MSKPNNPPPVIDWAIEHARASLRVGVSVPEIESRLVARGLDPMIAEAAVTHALSDRIRGPNEFPTPWTIYWIVGVRGKVLFRCLALLVLLVLIVYQLIWFSHIR